MIEQISMQSLHKQPTFGLVRRITEKQVKIANFFKKTTLIGLCCGSGSYLPPPGPPANTARMATILAHPMHFFSCIPVGRLSILTDESGGGGGGGGAQNFKKGQ
jgi:hypothetical protein